MTCAGSKWGQCCSAHGYCGSGDDYCGLGCASHFGVCSQGTTSAGLPAGSPLPTGTQREGPNPLCPVCPVCTICTSTLPGMVPSSCRVILTATSWLTATTTQTTLQVQTQTQTQTQTQIQTETYTTTVTTNSLPMAATDISLPSPIFPGAVPDCKRWYKTQDGDTCRTVAEAANISRKDLRRWNTRIGHTSDDTTICEGRQIQNLCRVPCGDLWPGYYLCVGV